MRDKPHRPGSEGSRTPGAASASVRLSAPSLRNADVFLGAVGHSRRLHGRWVRAPSTREQYEAFVRRSRGERFLSYLVWTDRDELGGVVNVNEIVRGAFLSGYLGYYAFAPHDGRGYMKGALRRVVALAFEEHGLHRLEANIQPDNARSLALVESVGFRYEGFSPRYLKIGGRWRDHERWALTREEWAGGKRRAGR